MWGWGFLDGTLLALRELVGGGQRLLAMSGGNTAGVPKASGSLLRVLTSLSPGCWLVIDFLGVWVGV